MLHELSDQDFDTIHKTLKRKTELKHVNHTFSKQNYNINIKYGKTMTYTEKTK